MCLAIPVQIEKRDGNSGVVSLSGSSTTVLLSLVPEAKAGDWVLVHAGFAITVLDEAEARETYDLLAELAQDPAMPPAAEEGA